MIKFIKNLFAKKDDDTKIDKKYFCISSRKYISKSEVYFTYEEYRCHEKAFYTFHNFYKLEKETILCLSKKSYKEIMNQLLK